MLDNLSVSEKYQYNDYYDLDYFGLRDIETLFSPVDNYYKPMLTKSSFKNKYQYYEIRGDKNKNLSMKQYLATILPELAKLINERKTSSEDEQKIQFIMSIRFRHDTDIGKSRTIYVRSDNVDFRIGSDTDEVLTKLFESFLNKYGYEEDTPRDGSNYSFYYVDTSAIHFHEVELKRGS